MAEGSPICPSKKRSGHFSVEEKEMVLKIYNAYDEANPTKPIMDCVEFAAKTAGVSLASVYNIRSEYKKKRQLQPPKVYHRRRAVLDNISEETKSAVKRIMNSFVERNERPTINKILAAVHEVDYLPRLKRSSLGKLIREMEFRSESSFMNDADPTTELLPNSDTDNEADGNTASELDKESEKSEPIVNVITKLEPMYEDQKVYCRLCLEQVDKKSLTPLGEIDLNYPGKTAAFKKKKLEEAQEIHKMLKLCLPFFDALVFNPSVCSACLTKLKVSYQFATKCQNNQQLVDKYADNNCTSTTVRVVDINKMIETKFALSDDAHSSNTETEVPIRNGASKNKISSTQQMRLERTKCLSSGKDSPASKKTKNLSQENEGLVMGNYIDEHLYSRGTENIPLDKTNI